MMTETNYKSDPVANRRLCEIIKSYYRNHPEFGQSFVDKINIEVRFNEVSNGFEILSNLNELMANVVDVEEKYLG